MSDIDTFIKKEKNDLDNVLLNLTQEQTNEISGDVAFIKYLLDLLKNSDLSKNKKKDLEKKIEKNVDNLEKTTKEEQKDQIGRYTLTKNVTPNITELDEATIAKAKMVKASSIAYDTDFNQAQMFLDQNEIPYIIDTELSNPEGLVLHNPETADTKLAFRGTKFTSAEDLYTDGLILTGNEDGARQITEARNQVAQAKTKYGALPSETLGYSKGAHMAIDVADYTGIPESTTFNAFLGAGAINNKPTSTIHNLYRTTEDIPSILVGFKNNLENFRVNVIRPLYDSLDIRKAHDLNNFLSNKKRATRSTLEDLSTELGEAGARHGEADMLQTQKEFLENRYPSKYKKMRDDKLNESRANQPKDSGHPFLSGDLDIDDLQTNLDLNYPTETQLNYDEIYDHYGDHVVPSEFQWNPSGKPSTQSIENINLRTLDNDFVPPLEDLKSMGDQLGAPPSKTGKPLFSSPFEETDIPIAVIKPPPSKNFADWVHYFNSESGSDTVVDENGKVKLNSSRFRKNSRHVKLWKELGQELTEEEKAHMNSYESGEEDDKFYLDKKTRKAIIDADEAGENAIIEKLQQKRLDLVDKVNDYVSVPDEEGNNVGVTSDILRAAHPMNLAIGALSNWTTNKALNFYDPDQKKLTRDQRTEISGFLTGAQSAGAISYLSGATASVPMLLTEGIAGGVGAYTADKTFEGLRKAGFGEDSSAIISGGTGGFATGLTSGLLTSGLGLETVAGATTGGIVGASLATGIVAGQESYKALRNAGVNKPVASGLAGGAGGAAASATAVGATVAAAALTGGEYGTFLAPETAGLSVAVGALIGAGIGEASYLIGKL